MNRFSRFFNFVKDLSKQSVRVKLLGGRQLVYFSKTFYNQKSRHSLHHLDDVMAQGEMLKKGNSTTVVKAELSEQVVVIKRYNTNSIFSGLKQLIRVSAAYNSWFIAHWLLRNNIPTPRPLAAVELSIGLFRKRSYYIYEYLEFKSLKDLVLNAQDAEELDKICEKVVLLFKAMHKARLSHRDFKVTNLLMHHDEICVIDLDHASYRYSSLMLNHYLRKDRNRFVKNFKDNPELHAFFKEKLRVVNKL